MRPIAAIKVQPDKSRRQGYQRGHPQVILPLLARLDQPQFFERFELRRANDLAAGHHHLTRLIGLDHRLDGIARGLAGGLGQFPTAEAVRRDKSGYQFCNQPRLLLGQCQADQRGHPAADDGQVVLANSVAHDLFQHTQSFLLDRFPAGCRQVQDLFDSFRFESQVAQGLQIRLLLFWRGEFVGAYQANIIEGSPQAFDLTARDRWVGRRIDLRDGTFGCCTSVFSTHFADVFDGLGSLQVTRRNVA